MYKYWCHQLILPLSVQTLDRRHLLDNMSRSRSWQFTVLDEAQHAIITKQVKEHVLDNVTFLQLCKDKGLVVMKRQVRQSAVRKMFSITDIVPVSSPKEVRDSMENVTFSYGSLLNKHQKKLASKSTNYAEAVQNFAKTVLVPEEHPKFELVYNIIASADTVEEGMLKVLEDLPYCRSLISCAVRRYKLKQEQLSHIERKEESRHIVWKPWQQELLTELETSPDPRKIIWYYDEVGNTGKTYFAKWQRDLNKSTALLQSGKAKDIYHILSKKEEEIRTVLMDCTRSAEYEVDYNAIEAIKNGCFQSTKYDSRFVNMPSPHFVVFANFKPDIKRLSEDRWDIRILSKTQTETYIYKAIQCTSHNEYFCGSCCPNHPEKILCECKCKRHKRLNCTVYVCKKDTIMKGENFEKREKQVLQDNENKKEQIIATYQEDSHCDAGKKDGVKNMRGTE